MHLLVGRGREVDVPLADAVEVLRGDDGDKLVGFVAQVADGGGRRRRGSDDDPLRIHVPQGLDRRANGGTGGDSVVDQDDRPAAHERRRAVTPIRLLPAPQFGALPGDGGLDGLNRDLQGRNDRHVKDLYAPARDGAHGVLLLARDPELAHDKDVHRRMEALGDRVGDRDAAPGQGEHEDIGAVCVCEQLSRQEPAGLGPVPKVSAHGIPAAQPGRFISQAPPAQATVSRNSVSSESSRIRV